jgi:hypothetical protein
MIGWCDAPDQRRHPDGVALGLPAIERVAQLF